MLQRSRISQLLLAGLFLLFSAVPGAAQQPGPEVVSVRTGTFVFDATTQQGTLELAGTKGFRLTGTVFLAGGHFEPYFQCNANDACPGGAEVNLQAGWGGLDLHATASLRGRTFGTASETGGGVVGFTGALTLPVMTEPQATASAPFEFAGLVQFIQDDGSQIRAVLAGGGTATLALRSNELAQSWLIE